MLVNALTANTYALNDLTGQVLRRDEQDRKTTILNGDPVEIFYRFAGR